MFPTSNSPTNYPVILQTGDAGKITINADDDNGIDSGCLAYFDSTTNDWQLVELDFVVQSDGSVTAEFDFTIPSMNFKFVFIIFDTARSYIEVGDFQSLEISNPVVTSSGSTDSYSTSDPSTIDQWNTRSDIVFEIPRSQISYHYSQTGKCK